MSTYRTFLAIRSNQEVKIFDTSNKNYTLKSSVKIPEINIIDMAINWRLKKIVFISDSGTLYSRGFKNSNEDFEFDLPKGQTYYQESYEETNDNKINNESDEKNITENYKSLAISQCGRFLAVSSSLLNSYVAKDATKDSDDEELGNEDIEDNFIDPNKDSNISKRMNSDCLYLLEEVYLVNKDEVENLSYQIIDSVNCNENTWEGGKFYY